MNAAFCPPSNLISLNESEMARLVAALGWPGYRSGQILRWLYQRRVRTVDEMTDLSRTDRAKLRDLVRIGRPPGCVIFRSADSTRKLVLTLEDGLEIESVLIPDDDRLTLSRVDYELPIPEPYTPQIVPDDYRCFFLDWPAADTTFSSIIREPKSLAPNRRAIWPTFIPMVTHEAWMLGTLSSTMRAMAWVRR